MNVCACVYSIESMIDDDVEACAIKKNRVQLCVDLCIGNLSEF